MKHYINKYKISVGKSKDNEIKSEVLRVIWIDYNERPVILNKEIKLYIETEREMLMTEAVETDMSDGTIVSVQHW